MLQGCEPSFKSHVRTTRTQLPFGAKQIPAASEVRSEPGRVCFQGCPSFLWKSSSFIHLCICSFIYKHFVSYRQALVLRISFGVVDCDGHDQGGQTGRPIAPAEFNASSTVDPSGLLLRDWEIQTGGLYVRLIPRAVWGGLQHKNTVLPNSE